MANQNNKKENKVQKPKDVKQDIKNDEQTQTETIIESEVSKQDESKDLHVKVEELTKQLNQEKELKLLTLADFDNYKKRVQKDREELTIIGNATILNILLEILDDLERGLSELEKVPVGLSMIKDKVKHFLDSQNIEEVEVNPDDKFDPGFMEAIGTINITEPEKDNKVIHVDRKAYKLKSKDMLIRTARVIVGKKS